jgi:hypothetical protein
MRWNVLFGGGKNDVRTAPVKVRHSTLPSRHQHLLQLVLSKLQEHIVPWLVLIADLPRFQRFASKPSPHRLPSKPNIPQNALLTLFLTFAHGATDLIV